jgi:hypothetical protein
MATSPNYGWAEPDNTDLVKDGALAMRTLGDAIDTTMATMTPKSIVDAKGDLIAASANDTPARLAVGNNGETLVADSSTSTGLRYQGHIEAGKNFVINGGMDVWQRGTTGFATTAGTYTADRWRLGSNNTTVTRDTDVPVSPYFTYSLKMVGTAANSIIQRIESANSTLLAGQTVTFSFYAKRTAGTGNLDVRFYYPTAVDNFASTTQIGSTQVVSASPSSSWVRYSATVAIGTNITNGLEILINNDASGGSTTFITGAMLELGSVNTSFSRAGATIQGELAACQRYYWRSTPGGTYSIYGGGVCGNATSAYITLNLPVQMRKSPPTSINVPTTISNLHLTNAGTSNFVITAISLDGSSTANVATLNVTSSGLTTGQAILIRNDNTATAFIGVNAEL